MPLRAAGPIRNEWLSSKVKIADRSATRKGDGQAIIFTARKLTGIICRTLNDERVFEDFPNFVLAGG
jgi:hypothetical protein